MSTNSGRLPPGDSRPEAPPVDDPFADFVRRIRAGDAGAAADLVRRYESAVRLEVRVRLRNSRLRRVVESMDVVQSVLASFFVRAAAGQYDLDRPEQLLKLLVVIARNKVADQARKERAQCRDHRRVEEIDPADVAVAGRGQSPSQMVAGEELLREFRRRLSAEEQRIAELRSRDRGWDEIAAELGGTPQGRRMQLTRAIERVARQLGLEGRNQE